jgi:hypothetical protein
MPKLWVRLNSSDMAVCFQAFHRYWLKRSSYNAKRLITILIVVLFSSAILPLEVFAQDDYFHQNFEWTYDGQQWEWSLTIPKYLYENYRSVPVYSRIKDGPAGYGFLTTTDDPYLCMVAEKLHQASMEQGYDSYNEVSFILAFVQSLPYATDSVTSGYDEYPRFPLETLVENGGDCEDTAILFSTLTLILNYGTIYINPPNHVAVGVLGKDLQGYYWTYSDKQYYYCETTTLNTRMDLQK